MTHLERMAVGLIGFIVGPAPTIAASYLKIDPGGVGWQIYITAGWFLALASIYLAVTGLWYFIRSQTEDHQVHRSQNPG